MRSNMPSSLFEPRAREKGAALITAVLLSLLLLAAGGTLILTTTMTGLTARDSTAEMQAYYAAEAGVARALEVLRGNVESTPTGTRASFRNVICSPMLWTTTSNASVNVTSDGTTRFQVSSIYDPDNQVTAIFDTATQATACADASYKPDRLRIQVLGVGPKDSQKNMEVVVNRYTVDYDVNAVVTLPNSSTSNINFWLGNSNPTATSGVDVSGTGTTLAAFSVGNIDYTVTSNVIDGCQPNGSQCNGNGPNVTPGDPSVLGANNTPSFLQSVPSARAFLYGSEGMMAAAVNQGRYFTTGAAAEASTAGLGASHPDGVLTFVDGDLILQPGNPSGQGTLIVTGTLTLKGNFQWNGVIMVLGKGEVYRDGGGHGNIYGAMFVAKFDKTGTSTDPFQAPTFDTSGGGTANIQYSSDAVDRAKSVGGHSIRGVREF